MSEPVQVHVEVTTTLAARFTAGYERLVRSVLAGLDGPDGAGIEVVPVVATGSMGHRRLTDSERERLAHHPAGGTNRRRADRFGPLSPVVRRAVAVPAVGRVRAGVAARRRRLLRTPGLAGLDLGIPPIGSIWLDLEPAWNDPAPRQQLLTRLGAEGVHRAVLVADVMPELFGEWFDDGQRRLFGGWVQAHLQHSELFLCISQNTENDLREVARRRGVTRELHCVVVPLGADLPTAEPRPLDLPAGMRRYLLVVGTLEPRKNQQLVLDAFDRLRRRHDDLGVVLVGRQGWLTDELADRIRAHPDYGHRLLWPDAVDDGQLSWLYRHAFLTIAPSRYEGLGVPVMEALAHGCPTVSSTGGALPEAGDGRVETIDPDDVDGLCVVVERHLLDEAHHTHWRKLAEGYRAPSWDGAAQVVAEALRSLAAQPPPTLRGRPAAGRRPAEGDESAAGT